MHTETGTRTLVGHFMPLDANQTAVDCGVRTRPDLGDIQTPIPSIRHTHFKILADGDICPMGSIIEVFDVSQPDLRSGHDARLLRVPHFAGSRSLGRSGWHSAVPDRLVGDHDRGVDPCAKLPAAMSDMVTRLISYVTVTLGVWPGVPPAKDTGTPEVALIVSASW